MKLKNIKVGDFIEAKNKHGGDIGLDVLEVGKSYEVIGFNEYSDLSVIISVPNNRTFHDGLYVSHECFRKPKPKPKQLDQSIFKEWDDCWKFFATDEDGKAWRYREEPKIDNGDNRWSSSNTVPLLIGTGYDASNWRDSLIKRDDLAKELLEVDLSSELSGSELCKAMLARGDTRIMCRVYDIDRQHDITHVIRAYRDGKFHTKANRWTFAIPINNQGEPLTARDVGI